MRHYPQQPLVVDRVEEAADIGIEHPVHALAHDRRMLCIKRHVRITPRPKAIGEPAKVGLVDGTQHLGNRALDDLVLQPLFVLRHCHPIDPSTRLPLLSWKRPIQGSLIDVMQKRGKPGLGSPSGRRVHPLQIRRQGNPALRPDPGLSVRAPLGLAPSLHASRLLRRFHWYYEPVRLPTSARAATPAVPCCCPPLETNPAAPVGPLMFR